MKRILYILLVLMVTSCQTGWWSTDQAWYTEEEAAQPAKRASSKQAPAPSNRAPSKRASAKRAPSKRAPAKQDLAPSRPAPAKQAPAPSNRASSKQAPAKRAPAPAPVDVFYICSTDVIESNNPDGSQAFNAVLDSAERAALKAEMTFARTNLFPDSLNFYSPYYHQVTMNGYFDEAAPEHLEKAALELREAFGYYMRHFNHGRPFILAGFSQGAMLTVDLLRHLTDKQYSRLVAAYSIGYGLDSLDIAHSHIEPATGARDNGVCISFNSVTDSTGIWPLVHHTAATCINPVNWRTDGKPASFSYPLANGSGGASDHQLTVSVDTLRHVLLVPGFRAESSPYWPDACLHHYDLLFYAPQIRRNALDRAYRGEEAPGRAPKALRAAAANERVKSNRGM